MLRILKKIIPTQIFNFFQPTYHYLFALTGALIYRFPAKKLVIIGVTGTKGKSTVAELMNSVLETAGYETALQSTIKFKIGEKEKRNLYKMSMPGRFFMQKFLREAVDAGCTHAILEMTSEGAKQFRHKFIWPDALIFTNLAPEHIESHGSYEKYLEAKLKIARELEGQKKSLERKVWPSEARRPEDFSSESFFSGPVIIVNTDDKEAEKFLKLNIEDKIKYSLGDAHNVESNDLGNSFQVGKMVIHSKLPGKFNLYNMLAVIACAKFFEIPEETIKKGLEKVESVRGRAEKIENDLDIQIIVDYAHTPESLRALYETYNKKNNLICVLGNTGGGRDKWKRPEMGKIADEYCNQIILTNEDPYDEDPVQIIEGVRSGIKNKKVEVVLDRRVAINKALNMASKNDAVLITGKGTDPYIMGPNGNKQEWDDASVTREELRRIMKQES